MRRSITFDGAGNFPLLQPRQGELIPEMLGQSAAKVEDVVYIGTNLVYAEPVENRRGYMAETFDWLLNGVIEKTYSKEVDVVLEEA